jgi:hypothetical protein
MTHDLDIRHFLRASPKVWLRRYFERVGVLDQIEWSSIHVRNVEPLMDGLRALDEDVRGGIVQDFSEIKLLSTPAGKVQIIDEAMFHGKQEAVSTKLAELSGYHECAFWTYFEHPDCWQGAVSFAEADNKPRRQWRKRINLPALGRAATADDGRALAAAIIGLFRRTEGRGDNCVVEQYRRGSAGEKEYYFAYPQDHRQVVIEYNNGKMILRPHRPAFEIIFIHDDRERTLSIWHQGTRERTTDLQLAFAKAVLGADIERESPRDDRVYDLDGFLNPDFALVRESALGITSAQVRQITVRVLGPEPYTINVALGAKTAAHTLQQALRGLSSDIKPSMLKVSRVRLRVVFEESEGGRAPVVRQFDLTWPNSCNLTHDSYGILIQRMLVAHGIEPRRPDGNEPG